MSIHHIAAAFLDAEGVIDAFPGGSRIICPDHVHEGSDYDVCVLTEGNPYIRAVHEYEDCGSADDYDTDDDFAVYRKGEINVLIFTDRDEFEAVRDATEHCRLNNVTDKAERYAYFEQKRAEAKSDF